MGIRERKQREYARRKSLILATARRMFRRKGLNGVTLDDIAGEIEFSKGTIYSHFDSKEEIFAQILLEHLNALIEYLKRAQAESSDAADGVRRALDAYLRFYDQNREYGRLLFFVDALNPNVRIPESLRQEIQRRKLACLAELQRILKKGAEPRGDVKQIALLLWGMLNGVLQLVESKQIGRNDLDSLIALGFDVVMAGLSGRPARSTR